MFSVTVFFAAVAAILIAFAALRLLQKQAGGRFSPRRLARCAVIAAVYVAFCLVLAPFSYGAVQVRIAEALCLLPVFGAEYILGVTLGCALANLLGSTMVDVLFGTLATFLACLCTWAVRHARVGGLAIPAAVPPIVWNAAIVGTEIAVFFSNAPATPALIFANALSVGAGEVISCGVLGVALVRLIEANPRLLALFTDRGVRA